MSAERPGGEVLSRSVKVKLEILDYLEIERGRSAIYQALIDYRAVDKYRASRLRLIDELCTTTDLHDKITQDSQLRITEKVLVKIESRIDKKKSKKPGYYEAYKTKRSQSSTIN